jgi:hypothetical protein
VNVARLGWGSPFFPERAGSDDMTAERTMKVATEGMKVLIM